MAAVEKRIDLGPDDKEIERLTAQHKIMKSCYEKLILAPIDLSKPGLRILDSGCADGLWLREVQPLIASPHSLIGTDFNPNLFPSDPPGQIMHQAQDITKPWPADWANSFDFVHQRLVLGGCGPFGPEKAVKHMIELVKPGGWIQLDEMDLAGEQQLPGMGGELGRIIRAVFEASGGQWDFATKMKQWMIEAGLENVEEKTIHVAFGKSNPDPEIAKLGIWSLTTSTKALCFAGKTEMGIKGFTEAELDSMGERCEKELIETGVDSPMLSVWGRKPL
ncbi:S-adenosyl-L-methionine-dependent methyltransferase [Mollisia scopiformis]|uniref:S-adenosyl-L-methionine-dependent methyltransferase n=1 Tax=Mollisia scopiformis TaxID=149040 RepID=A0A194XGI9_MOLSC|nr:S-adenosyl-L-methionine-dependent methyltransferase [Mollisia scopiformis]KUJ19283.1 S-adenosyl-L-methionine-dependent methyltransferase [Mollisia scopiformis]